LFILPSFVYAVLILIPFNLIVKGKRAVRQVTGDDK
jgi:hypothetical protein